MKKYFILFPIIAIALAGAVFLTTERPPEHPSDLEQVETRTISTLLAIDAVLPEGEVLVAEGESAFTQLTHALEAHGIPHTTKTYAGLGTLVESIGALQNGTDGKYWQYFVNGELAMVGAEQYVLKPNDLIEWRFVAPAPME